MQSIVEVVREIINYALIVIVGGFSILAFISIICGAIRSIVLNVKEYGWNVNSWKYEYNQFTGVTKE